MLTQMQITILSGAAGPETHVILHGLPQLPPCYCTAERPPPELKPFKADVILPSHLPYSAS